MMATLFITATHMVYLKGKGVCVCVCVCVDVSGKGGGGSCEDTDLAPENNSLISRMSVSTGTQIEVASS